MNTSTRRTEGATLFVVVLMVLFLLTAIMAITAQVTLSSRKNTGDQENTLRAQYAVESTVSRAQAQMAVLNTVLSSGSSSSGVKYGIVVPDATYASSIASQIMALCSISSLPFPSLTNPICGTNSPGSDIFNGAVPSKTQLGIFNTYISQDALKSAGAPVKNSETQNAFWQQSFGGTNNGSSLDAVINEIATTGRFGMVINKVMQVGRDSYQIYMTVPDFNLKSQGSNSVQALRMGMQGKQYVLAIARKNFSDYALMTNHHYSNLTGETACKNNAYSDACKKARIFFTDNTNFTGPVHTNEQFNFAYADSGNGNSGATFAGPVTSAGCNAGTITVDTNNKQSCTSSTAGAFYYNSASSTGSTFALASAAPLNQNGQVNTSPKLGTYSGKSPCPNVNCTQPSFNGGVNWNAQFVQMPPDSSDQVSSAKNGGLYLSSGISDLTLSVDDLAPSGGANQHMQLISYTKSGSKTPTQLAINASGKVFIMVGAAYVPAVQSPTTFEWVDQSSPAAANSTANTFNGVVYADYKDGISSLHGPARSNSSDPNSSKPAVAKFMQMTVASVGDIAITGDLKYEDRVCNGKTCDNTSATNVLGIYAAGPLDKNGNSLSDVTIVSPDSGKSPAAPDDVNVDGVLMSRSGSVTVDGFDTGTSHKNVNLTGGIIENYYGGFGTFGGTGGPTGYGRNFVYDPRMGKGLTPPAFPGTNIWTSGIQDTASNPASMSLKSGTLVRQSLADYTAAGGQ